MSNDASRGTRRRRRCFNRTNGPRFSRRNMLLGALRRWWPRRRWPPARCAGARPQQPHAGSGAAVRPASRTSSSSSATTSASRTSAPTRTALMGYETPNIDRIGREGIMFTALLRRAVLHRRPRGVPHRPARHPHRPDQGRLPRRADGHEPARSVDRRPAQEPRLRHRPVRQEPRRRSQRIAADRATASTSSSATSITSTPRKSRNCRTIRRTQRIAPSSGRAACCRCKATDTRRSHRRSALRQDRQADHRGHRCADQEAHGDDRRRDLGRGHRLHEAAASGGQAVLLLVQLDPHASADARSRRASRPLHRTATANTSTACSSTTTPSARCSRRSTTWASPTTPSSSTPATTART